MREIEAGIETLRRNSSPSEADEAEPGSQAEPLSETVAIGVLLEQLRHVNVFSGVEDGSLSCLGDVEVLSMQPGQFVSQEGEMRSFLVVLEGRAKLQAPASRMIPLVLKQYESFGEIPILANKKIRYTVTALEPLKLLRFPEEKFWKLMFACPSFRKEVLGNMALRLEAYQAQEVRREKLSSLGALAAGLMHELKNPGTAAIRAASQMRENLIRLQQLTLKLSKSEHSTAQQDCLTELQQMALGAVCCKAMSSLEQSDAEEAMEQQLEKAGVENGWKVASTLISMGMTANDLGCVSSVFNGEELSDSLNWLESLVSSVQLVGTIEESLGRVHDLIMAVKHYSYEDESSDQVVDIHNSIQSTLLILGHKLRSKSLTMERQFDKNLPPVHLRGGGLNQVWTNLLDNAIDASPEGAAVSIKTWQEAGSVCVAIEDHGSGIAPGDAQHVFEPFFTTKPVGQGTGLGLDIVHRILGLKLGGSIKFDSVPGKTVFTVTLPIEWKNESRPVVEHPTLANR